MTTEEFQKLVLEKFENLEMGQKALEVSVKNLEIGQTEIKNDIKSIVKQTADLTEFREEVKEKLDTLIEDNISIHGILGEHEVSIRTLKRRAI